MTSGNNIETEYKEINSKNNWPALYQRIRTESQKDSSSITEANKPQNKLLNRYRDVSPYDHSRIVLQRGSTDYINANLIKIEKANRQYILTQGPLATTVDHFWLMVWEQKSKAILMLNKLIEKKQEKCYQYWPSEQGAENMMTLKDVGLTIEYLKQEDNSYYLTRTFRITDTESQEQREVLQFHYITWPDFGVPDSPTAFLEFLYKVRLAGVLEEDVGPAVVHCSAGIGRSGTFCLVDSCLVLIEKNGLNSVDVKEILLEMRKYRMGLIQTPEQLRFSYQAIIEGAKLFNPDYKGSGGFENDVHDDNSDKLVEESSSEVSDEDDDEPPPLPPPRAESLSKPNGMSIDKPLPKIPNSVSDEFTFEDKSYDEEHVPSGPLPVAPVGEEEEMSSEDELIEEEARSSSPTSEKSDNTINSTPASEMRQRKRQERKDNMEAQVRDMKRRQQINEQWTQLKRSLFKPILIGGTLVVGSSLLYFYFKN